MVNRKEFFESDDRLELSKTMTDKEFFWVGIRQWIHIVNGHLYFSVREIIVILLLVMAVLFGVVLFFVMSLFG